MSVKVALITGSSRGIGLGLVKEYVLNGYKVVATARSPESATELQTFLQEHGQPKALPLDISSQSSIQSCKELVAKQGAVIDILINNAGISNKNHPGKSQCLKITQNVAFEFFNLGIFHLFCPTKIDQSGNTV